MKKIVVLGLTLLLLFTMCACGGVDTSTIDDELQGTWLWISDTGLMEIHYSFINGEATLVDFILGEKNDAVKGTYEIKSKYIAIELEGRDTVKLSYSYENGEFVLGSEDIELTKWY